MHTHEYENRVFYTRAYLQGPGVPPTTLPPNVYNQVSISWCINSLKSLDFLRSKLQPQIRN